MESNEATTQTKKDTSKLCRASTYCVIAAVGINLLFVIFAESPYQRMVDVGQKLEELPEVALSNTNKPPNENQGLSNEEVDYLKKEAEKRMDIGIGGIIGLLKGSLLHLLIIVLSLLICMTGFILDVVDAVMQEISRGLTAVQDGSGLGQLVRKVAPCRLGECPDGLPRSSVTP